MSELYAEIERLTREIERLTRERDHYLEHGNLRQMSEIERLRAVFEEACNEVRMCHNKPCYCKYCFQEPKP